MDELIPVRTSRPSARTPTEGTSLRAQAIAVGAVYAVQGLGYAIVVTALPSFQEQIGLDEGMLAMILLGICVAAAVGSLLADLIAVRRSSRVAVIVGLAMQAACVLIFASVPSLPIFALAAFGYGVGLGIIDASSNMQGVRVQRADGVPLLGRFYALYTAGAIIGALAMSAGLFVGGGAATALLIAAAVQVLVVFSAGPHLDRERTARSVRAGGEKRTPLPRGPIVVSGFVVLAAFTIDSGVSAWSSVHIAGLGASAALAPMGYAAYLASVLVARLVTDPLQRRLGSRPLLVAALVVGAAGGLVVAAVPGVGAAIVGFALSGFAVGALVPIAFGLAGRIAPERSDEVVARVNLFNYAGALLGAVGIGLLIDSAGGSLAFLLPVIVLGLGLPALRAVRS